MRLDRIVNLNAYSSTTELNDNAKRNYVVSLCSLWCPSEAGEPMHDFVTQGRHQWGGYSSCADQWNAVPWMMGCVSQTMLNRADVETGNTWRTGVNISKTLTGARSLACWRGYKSEWGAYGFIETLPNPGDMLLMGDFSKGEMEHVCVVEQFELVDGKTYMHSFDYGQFANGKKCSLRVRREWKGGRLYSPSGKSRAIIGWIDVCKVPLERNAVDLETFEP